jgi:hypothetical protein
MSRFVRQILFASVIALHAVVSLCGPCLHEFAGSSHQLGLTSKTHGPDDPARSPRDSGDNCLICHFVTQGQLPVEGCSQVADLAITELPAPSPSIGRLVHIPIPSSPRAPPEAVQS